MTPELLVPPEILATPEILVTTPIPEPGMRILAEGARITVLDDSPTYEELAEAAASGRFDAIVSQVRDRFDRNLLSRAQIRGVSNYAVGYDNIDIAAATENSIAVANTPGVLTDATADIAILLMLATARRAVEADALVRRGEFMGWKPDLALGTDVSGRTLGLAGFGRIARATARRALGFGMRVIVCPRPPADREMSEDELAEFAGRVEHVDWLTLITESDFLSLHVPLTADTRHLIDADVLRRMRPSAILVNTARGPVVDETELVRALRHGVIAAAGLDVYENEPALADGLAELPNTVLLPHVGSATVRVRSEMARLCALNAIEIAHGREPLHRVV